MKNLLEMFGINEAEDNPLVAILNKYSSNFDETMRQKLLTFVYNVKLRDIPPENMEKMKKGWEMFVSSMSKVGSMNQRAPEAPVIQRPSSKKAQEPF